MAEDRVGDDDEATGRGGDLIGALLKGEEVAVVVVDDA